MGSSQQAGNFYALRIPIESQPPLLNPNASLTEESLFIVVIDAAGIRSQAVHSIGEPGSARRLDFGAAIPDADGDGLPDAWELLHFGTTTPGANTTGVNGQTAGMNYIAGTNPNDTNSLFRVSVRTLADNVEVSFNTVQAQGPGYEGRTRYYGLEHASDPAAGWSGVTGFTNILANNLPVVLLSPATNGPVFYRGQVWLSGP
jgi:hypothetical protein